MTRTCTICGHRSRVEIDEALVSGRPIRRIAVTFGLAESSLRRHRRNHVPEALVQAQAAQDVCAADTLLGKIQGLESDARRIGARAEQDGDLRAALAAVRELVRICTLLATLKGELTAGGQLNVNVGAAAQVQEEPEDHFDWSLLSDLELEIVSELFIRASGWDDEQRRQHNAETRAQFAKTRGGFALSLESAKWTWEDGGWVVEGLALDAGQE